MTSSMSLSAVDVIHKRRVSSIGSERQWRCPGDECDENTPQKNAIVVSRWIRNDSERIEVVNHGNTAHHCIAMNLKCTSLTFSHAGQILVRGRVTAGAIQITAPDVPCGAVFDSAADVLHLFVSQQVLGECFEDTFGRPHKGELRIDDPKLVRDPALERLAQALAVLLL